MKPLNQNTIEVKPRYQEFKKNHAISKRKNKIWVPISRALIEGKNCERQRSVFTNVCIQSTSG